MKVMKMLNDKQNKIYLIGIGGAGMTPLALLLKENGYLIAGTDANKSTNTKMLEDAGITIHYNHSKSNIDNYDIAIVYSKRYKKNMC